MCLCVSFSAFFTPSPVTTIFPPLSNSVFVQNFSTNNVYFSSVRCLLRKIDEAGKITLSLKNARIYTVKLIACVKRKKEREKAHLLCDYDVERRVVVDEQWVYDEENLFFTFILPLQWCIHIYSFHPSFSDSAPTKKWWCACDLQLHAMRITLTAHRTHTYAIPFHSYFSSVLKIDLEKCTFYANVCLLSFTLPVMSLSLNTSFSICT